MKILITGGAGFIGSHVADKYIEAGHDVVIVDNLSSGKEENINPLAKFYKADIKDKEVLESIFDSERPDIVNNHAAQKSVPYSVENPIQDAEINIIGLLNVLEACRKYEVKKFIFISSGGSLYGDTENIPTKEDNPVDMISPYAVAKLAGEKYLNFYNRVHGLKYTVLRYSNVYGPRQIADGECGVLPIFMDNIIDGKDSVLFTYSDMPKGVTRDYVYVKDVAEANLLSIEGGDDKVFNIGSCKEIHIAELFDEIQKVTGTNLKLIKDKERPGDVRRSLLDCAYVKDVLGWEAGTSLEEGIKETYLWKKNQKQ
jgi:UDP-glucose 4-epimerase